jgi:hypothetical protein
MDNDALDSVDQLERAAGAVLDGLGGLAPAAIQNGVGGGNPGGGGRVLASHDADKDTERGSGMAARERPDFGNGSGHHENPSHTAIAIRPANASDIRYAVMSASLDRKKMRHDRFHAIISDANPIPPGAIRTADRREGPRAHVVLGHAAGRHVRACRLAGKRLGRQRALRRLGCFGDGAPKNAGRRPIEKARGRFPGAGSKNSCDDEDMPVICPTAQAKTCR